MRKESGGRFQRLQNLIQIVEGRVLNGKSPGSPSEEGLEPQFSIQSSLLGIPCRILISFLHSGAPVSRLGAKHLQCVFNIVLGNQRMRGFITNLKQFQIKGRCK